MMCFNVDSYRYFKLSCYSLVSIDSLTQLPLALPEPPFWLLGINQVWRWFSQFSEWCLSFLIKLYVYCKSLICQWSILTCTVKFFCKMWFCWKIFYLSWVVRVMKNLTQIHRGWRGVKKIPKIPHKISGHALTCLVVESLLGHEFEPPLLPGLPLLPDPEQDAARDQVRRHQVTVSEQWAEQACQIIELITTKDYKWNLH